MDDGIHTMTEVSLNSHNRYMIGTYGVHKLPVISNFQQSLIVTVLTIMPEDSYPDVSMRMVHLLDNMVHFKDDNKNNFNNKCNSKSWALNNPEEHMFKKSFLFFKFCFSLKNKTKICDIFYVCLKENKTQKNASNCFLC